MNEQMTNKAGSSEERPLITFALFAYNQEKYIREAVEGALAQTYSPLEIIFSDDCSSDRTFELIEEMVKDYRGPHEIRLNRNQKNLGLIEHVNRIFEISTGDFIVAAAGDDVSLPDRVECLVDAYVQSGKKALIIHSCAIKINDSNEELGVFIPPAISHSMAISDMADSRSLYIGATGGWNRSLYSEFGPIVYKNAYEDLVFGFRAAIKDALVYVDKPLVRYRVNVGITAKTSTPIYKFSTRKSARIKNLKTTLDVFEQRLRDLGCIKNIDEGSSLKARLSKNIRFQEKRLCFYNNPLTLLPQMFSKDFIHVFRALNSETKYLLGLND
jgi:glycosyltransferase involved in cell wall biosynthesis